MISINRSIASLARTDNVIRLDGNNRVIQNQSTQNTNVDKAVLNPQQIAEARTLMVAATGLGGTMNTGRGIAPLANPAPGMLINLLR